VEVSPDGAMLTIMAECVGPFGAKYRSTQVFTRHLSD
jgi:hypothetical protein